MPVIEKEAEEVNQQSSALTRKNKGKKKVRAVPQTEEEEPQGSSTEVPQESEDSQGSHAIPTLKEVVSSELPASNKKKRKQSEETSDETSLILQVYHKKGKHGSIKSPTIVEDPNSTIVESSNEDADEIAGMADQPEQIVIPTEEEEQDQELISPNDSFV